MPSDFLMQRHKLVNEKHLRVSRSTFLQFNVGGASDPNPPSGFINVCEREQLGGILIHQQGIRCKSKIPFSAGAPRSDD